MWRNVSYFTTFIFPNAVGTTIGFYYLETIIADMCKKINLTFGSYDSVSQAREAATNVLKYIGKP